MTTDRPAGDRLAVEQSPALGMRALLEEMIGKGASDLHISVNERPKLRIDGRLMAMGGERLRPKDTLELAYSVLTEQQKKRFEQDSELDFSFAVPKLSRFRGNVFRQRGSVAMAIRRARCRGPEGPPAGRSRRHSHRPGRTGCRRGRARGFAPHGLAEV